jgi:predicted transcriptional regulator YheO
MNPCTGFDEDQLGDIFDLLARIADVFAKTLGPTAEIVVHDLRHPASSVVAIAGDLTDREVGAPIPDPEFLPERLVEIESDQVCYPTTTSNGRLLRSSTVFIRDRGGAILGAVCINVDRNDLRVARQMIDHVLGETPPPTLVPAAPLTTFASNVDHLIRIALDDVGKRLGRPRHQFGREDRLEVIRELDRSGVFQLRNAAVAVANELGVSRASVFNYLREIRSVEPAKRASA